MNRWLQVTLPLTAVTLFVAWATYRLAESARGADPGARTKKVRERDIALRLNSRAYDPKEQTSKSAPSLSAWQSAQRFMKAFKHERFVPRRSWKSNSTTLPLHQSTHGDTEDKVGIT